MTFLQRIEERTEEILKKVHARYPQFKSYNFNSVIVKACTDHPHAIAEAHYYKNRIEYVHNYLDADFDYMLKEVVPHEIAHMVAAHMYGRWQKIASHGKEWRAIAIYLGATGKATAGSPQLINASRNMLTRKVKYYEYECAGEKFLVSGIMHNKISRGQARIHIPSRMKITINNFTGKMVIQ